MASPRRRLCAPAAVYDRLFRRYDGERRFFAIALPLALLRTSLANARAPDKGSRSVCQLARCGTARGTGMGCGVARYRSQHNDRPSAEFTPAGRVAVSRCLTLLAARPLWNTPAAPPHPVKQPGETFSIPGSPVITADQANDSRVSTWKNDGK